MELDADDGEATLVQRFNHHNFSIIIAHKNMRGSGGVGIAMLKWTYRGRVVMARIARARASKRGSEGVGSNLGGK
jgi:hypothetical protein